MTDPDLAVSDIVVIRCHACGSSMDADATAMDGGQRMVCRKCGETGPFAAGPGRRRSTRSASPAKVGASLRCLEAEQVPLIRYSGGLSTAWAAKIDGDVLPEDERRSRLPFAAAALAAVLFLAVSVAGREGAVAAAPDLARLYAAVGLPVNLAALEIAGLAAERGDGSDGNPHVVLRGTIRNLSRTEQTLPALSARLYAMDGTAAGVRVFAAPAQTIGAGEEMAFETELDSVPVKAAEVVLRFRRAGEPLSISNAQFESQ